MSERRCNCPDCPYVTVESSDLARHWILWHEWRPEEGQQAPRAKFTTEDKFGLAVFVAVALLVLILVGISKPFWM